MAVITTKEMEKLKEIDDKIGALYELQAKIVGRILERKGDSVGVLKLEGEGIEKPYMRVTLTDNYQPFMERDVVYRVASFRRYEAKIEYLKNPPK